MGLFKKIKKAIKKTVSAPVKVVQQVAKGDVGGAIKTAAMAPVEDVKGSISIAKGIGHELSNGLQAITGGASVPQVAEAPGSSTATAIENPEEDKGDVDDDSESASSQKKNKSTGKKSLTVARTSGGGVNI